MASRQRHVWLMPWRLYGGGTCEYAIAFAHNTLGKLLPKVRIMDFMGGLCLIDRLMRRYMKLSISIVTHVEQRHNAADDYESQPDKT